MRITPLSTQRQRRRELHRDPRRSQVLQAPRRSTAELHAQASTHKGGELNVNTSELLTDDWGPETAAEFFRSRVGWFRVEAVERADKRGWDIMLRIDGTYFSTAIFSDDDQRDMVQLFEKRIAAVLMTEGIAAS